MEYNSFLYGNKEVFADEFKSALQEKNFFLEKELSEQEEVYSFEISRGKILLIYTTIIENTINDFPIKIRSVVIDKNGKDKDNCNCKFVNKEGTIENIIENIFKSAREIYKESINIVNCNDCNSHLFLTKNNNLVCSSYCWDSDIFGYCKKCKAKNKKSKSGKIYCSEICWSKK